MNLGIKLCAVAVMIFYVQAEEHRFDGHKVLQISPKTVSELEKIMALHHIYDLDVWRHPVKGNHSFEVYVPPEKMEGFMSELKNIDAEVKVWIHDLQRLIDEEKSSVRRAAFFIPKTSTGRGKSQGRNLALNTYHRYSQIQAYIRDVAADSANIFGVSASVSSIGITGDGQQIDLIKISRGDGQSRAKIFIDGGIHAREWISPAFVLYTIDQLVYNTGVSQVANLLDRFEWHIVPVLNPDGYEWSHTNYRLWRKNRVEHRRNCFGTDLNRNFGYQWNPAVGGSTNECSDVFSGPSAFSEEESKALQNYMLANNANMIAYLTVHSYGQMWLYPWGYTSALPSDWQDLDHLAKTATNALTNTYGTVYQVGSSTNVLYSAAGGSDDWAKGGAGVKYSYTLELRDTGAYGFILPTSQIIPTCEETFNGLVAFCNELVSRGEA